MRPTGRKKIKNAPTFIGNHSYASNEEIKKVSLQLITLLVRNHSLTLRLTLLWECVVSLVSPRSTWSCCSWNWTIPALTPLQDQPHEGQPVLTGPVIRSSLTQLQPTWMEWSSVSRATSLSASEYWRKQSWPEIDVDTEGKWINMYFCVLKVFPFIFIHVCNPKLYA